MENIEKSYSINDFCEMQDISRSLFYKLLKQGRMPKVLKLGNRTVIPTCCIQEWLSSELSQKTSQSSELIK